MGLRAIGKEFKLNLIKDTIIELKLNSNQLKDKEIEKFVFEVAYRASTNEWYQYWNGNGYCELNKKDGTMITTVLNDNEEFTPEFPLNCDMNISTVCINGCAFCYEGCSKDGKHADIKKFIEDKNSFLYSLHAGTELALNGNEPLHPDLELLLNFCKERDIVANLTVNENTLIHEKDRLERYLDEGLLHGIGISPVCLLSTTAEFVTKHPTAVVHTIVGITSPAIYERLMELNAKVLILGYKTFGRGVEYKESELNGLTKNGKWLKEHLNDLINKCKVVSFDNLGIEQMKVKEWLPKEDWNTFYRGDDGHHTLYINLVTETFAKNSIQARTNHTPIMNDIRVMLKHVQH